MTKLLFCLDYDKTYDADPQLWDLLIPYIQRRHEVIVATYRDDRFDRTALLDELSSRIPVYYTRGVAKRWWLEQFAPEEHANPNIWIDDNPEAIFNNSKLPRDDLILWRETQKGNLPHGFQA